eukprot:scaffold2142_cov190-Cylindrotheca_fusiformis.AAC.4
MAGKRDSQHMTTTSATQPTSQQDDDNRRLASVVLPWTLIACAAIGSTYLWLQPFGSSSNNNNNFYDVRYLEKEEAFGEYANFEASTEGKHELVFEENHENLFPLSTSDAIGFTCAIVGLMIAAGGGIGGGGILVPIYILLMEFSPKHAIPLSNITIFGGAIANMILNVQKRHPLADRPLVDWDLILVMEPLTIAGALVGAFLNNIIPEIVLALMLVALLSFTAYNTLKKAIKMYNKESAGIREKEVTNSPGEASNLIDDKTETTASYQSTAPDEEAGKKANGRTTELDQILEAERRVPLSSLSILLVMFIVVLVINLAKGGGAFPSPLGIVCGSTAYWIANAIMLTWILATTFYVRSYLEQRYERKKAVGYKYAEGDIEWDHRALSLYPSVCSLAGFFAGMFGVGGGIVKGPLMLAMGVHPAVASATSACMILFTSSTATTSFFVFGLLDRTYAPVCFTIGLVATYVGQVVLSMVMKRTQRNSYIAFSIGFVVFLSAIMMTIQSFLAITSKEHHKTGGFCVALPRSQSNTSDIGTIKTPLGCRLSVDPTNVNVALGIDSTSKTRKPACPLLRII